MALFTKRKRVGTAAVGAAKPIYRDVFDWEAFWGVVLWLFVGAVVLSVIF